MLPEVFNSLSLRGADWVGLREVSEKTTQYVVRDGWPSTHEESLSRGTMVEVLKDGFIAYAATGNPSTEGLQEALDTALRIAEVSARHGTYRFTGKQRPPSKGSYKSMSLKPHGQHSPRELNEFLANSCERMKVSPRIHRTVSMIHMVESQHRLVGSNGLDVEQNFAFTSTGFKATAMEGVVVQSRSSGGFLPHSLQGGLECIDSMLEEGRLEAIGEQAVELLSAEECPSGTMDLVAMPDQMMLQIHESIGHPLELDRILGDERNYAGSSFVKLDDFGSLVYGPPLMNICFDPSVPQQYASYGFDDSGQPAQKEFLIKEGVLLRGLGGLESQVRSGVSGVANSRACLWNRPPIDRMANINLEPGESSMEEIIKSVELGVLMEANRSWSIDDLRRKFQFGCEYGKLIERGKVTKTLRNPNYRGVTLPFWKNLKMVGNSHTQGSYGTPYCGKGEPNQAIRVGHSSPVCLFSHVEVFGGAKS